MKKYLILTLAVLSVLMLSGCGKKTENKNIDNKNGEPNNVDNKNDEPKKVVGVVEYDSIKDKIVTDGSRIYFSKENDKLTYYYITHDNVVLLKNDFIYVYDEYGTPEESIYIVIDDSEFNLYQIKDNQITKLELTDERIKELIDGKYLYKINIKNNNLFKYSGKEFTGEVLVLSDYRNNYGYFDDIKKRSYNQYNQPIVYVIDKDNQKATRLDSKLIEPITDKETDNYVAVDPQPISNYTIDKKKKKITNNNTKASYDIYEHFLDNNDDDIKNIYTIAVFNENDCPIYLGIVNEKAGYVIEPHYDDISCDYHSDDSYKLCDGSDTTLLNGSRLISIATGELIYDSDMMQSLDNDHFIARKNNQNVLIDSTGKELLKATYIGYNGSFGYMTISDNNVKFYNTKMKEIKTPVIKEETYLKNDDYVFWSTGQMLVNVDVKNNKYFIYSGNEYSGTKLALISDCSITSPVYIIENNKLFELDNVLLKNYADMCF